MNELFYKYLPDVGTPWKRVFLPNGAALTRADYKALSDDGRAKVDSFLVSSIMGRCVFLKAGE